MNLNQIGNLNRGKWLSMFFFSRTLIFYSLNASTNGKLAGLISKYERKKERKGKKKERKKKEKKEKRDILLTAAETVEMLNSLFSPQTKQENKTKEKEKSSGQRGRHLEWFSAKELRVRSISLSDE